MVKQFLNHICSGGSSPSKTLRRWVQCCDMTKSITMTHCLPAMKNWEAELNKVLIKLATSLPWPMFTLTNLWDKVVGVQINLEFPVQVFVHHFVAACSRSMSAGRVFHIFLQPIIEASLFALMLLLLFSASWLCIPCSIRWYIMTTDSSYITLVKDWVPLLVPGLWLVDIMILLPSSHISILLLYYLFFLPGHAVIN